VLPDEILSDDDVVHRYDSPPILSCSSLLIEIMGSSPMNRGW